MLILPTRKRLERRRDALYTQLHKILIRGTVHQVEDIMRQIHGINLKLKNYFTREGQHESEELFEDKDPVEVEYSFEAEDPAIVSLEDLQGEIEI